MTPATAKCTGTAIRDIVTAAVPIVLLGLSRSGKTSAGKLLAERLHCSFYDTDEVIALRTGLSPRQLYRRHGVQALYAAEAAALRECGELATTVGAETAEPLLPREAMGTAGKAAEADGSGGNATEKTAAVIAAGGGICDNREAADVLAALPQRIFLYAEQAELFTRLTQEAHQAGSYPAFLCSLPAAQEAEASRLFSELYKRRTALYRKLCTAIVDTSGLSCAAVAQAIAEGTAL